MGWRRWLPVTVSWVVFGSICGGLVFLSNATEPPWTPEWDSAGCEYSADGVDYSDADGDCNFNLYYAIEEWRACVERGSTGCGINGFGLIAEAHRKCSFVEVDVCPFTGADTGRSMLGVEGELQSDCVQKESCSIRATDR